MAGIQAFGLRRTSVMSSPSKVPLSESSTLKGPFSTLCVAGLEEAAGFSPGLGAFVCCLGWTDPARPPASAATTSTPRKLNAILMARSFPGWDFSF